MSQRISGYERKLNDSYETPTWVTLALCPHIPQGTVWEPAAGSGKIAEALASVGLRVVQSDILTGEDFLKTQACPKDAGAIITNPPYGLAEEFISHSLQLASFVAMLLRTDFDHAKGRQHLFGGCPFFAKKLVLTRRIRWFEDSKGSPSFNHAWFIWDRAHSGAPVLAYV